MNYQNDPYWNNGMYGNNGMSMGNGGNGMSMTPQPYSGNQQNRGNNYFQGQQGNIENTFGWVYGDVGAQAFPVAPGRTVLLMDNEYPILYVKSADMNGRPLPLEVYELVKRDYQPQRSGYYSQAPQQDMSDYVKQSELENKVNEIMNRKMNNPQQNPGQR